MLASLFGRMGRILGDVLIGCMRTIVNQGHLALRWIVQIASVIRYPTHDRD